MTDRRRRNQAGKFNILTLLVLLGIATGGYLGYKFIPIYIEKSRISRLVKQAGNQWMNVDPNLEKVRAELQRNLTDGGITYVTANDVNIAQINNEQAEVWVDYKVKVKHFWKIKSTRLKFKIHHKIKRTLATE